MIGAIGFGPEVNIAVREKVAIINKHIGSKLELLLSVCQEAVVISTCNRTEVYFVKDIGDFEDILEILSWKDYRKYMFILREEQAVLHLFELACGFHSLIIGEEQILGQIKDFYKIARSISASKSLLNRLFERAIACGKEFRNVSELYKVPVSSASIVASEIEKRGIKDVLILGYGDVGRLCVKYLKSKGIKNIYVAVRDVGVFDNSLDSVKFLSFGERKRYMDGVECIISCTSSPHPVIKKDELPNRRLLIFDLAVPRDVDPSVYEMPTVEIYDIDSVSKLNSENIAKRIEIMERNRHIVEKYVSEFMEWYRMRSLTPFINNIKDISDKVYKKRYMDFKNKYKISDDFAEVLFKSTAYAFTNRAIEALKEEYLKGRGEECLRILKKIFTPEIL